MTAQEKEQILKEAGFEEVFMVWKRIFLYFNKFTQVKGMYFIKGLKKPEKLHSLEPTLYGTLTENRFMLEVDGKIWIKYLKNGENTDSLRKKGRR